jgi:peptide/nickel transport system substrate-binding protein
MKSRSWIILSIITMLSLLIGACGPGATATPEAPSPTEVSAAPTLPAGAPTEEPTPETEEPVVLRVAYLGPIVDCLNISYCWSGFWAWQVLYDALVDWGPVGEVVGRLAESWEISEDGLTWTFHLVDMDNVTFHDGTPLTAEDVAWSLEYIATNEAIYWLIGVVAEVLVSVEATDSQTVVMTFSEAAAPGAVLDALSYAYILPRHIWEQYDSETIYDFDNAENIGTGPFMISDWDPEQYLIMDANPDYWMGKPPVDQIIVQYYNTVDAEIQALIAGEVDAIEIVPVDFLDTLRDVPEITLNQRDPQFEYHFVFNMDEEGLRHPAIGDLRVRQAIAHAIDKQQIVDIVFGGNGIASNSIHDGGGRFEEWAPPDVKSYAFDLDEANRILDEAGYLDTDSDGTREMNDDSGESLIFRLQFQADKAWSQPQAEMIADWLGAIGISAEVEAVESVTLRDAIFSSKDFDMVIYFYGPLWDPDYNLFELTCLGVDWEVNIARYCNPEYDELYYAQRAALDKETRRDLIFEAQRIIHDDVAWIQLNFIYDFEAIRNDRFSLGITNAAAQFWGWYSIWGVEPVQ